MASESSAQFVCKLGHFPTLDGLHGHLQDLQVTIGVRTCIPACWPQNVYDHVWNLPCSAKISSWLAIGIARRLHLNYVRRCSILDSDKHVFRAALNCRL